MLSKAESPLTYSPLRSRTFLSRLCWTNRRALLFFFLFLIVLPSSANSQTQPPDEDIVKVSTDLLLFPVRVRNKHGLAVPGLTAANLSLRDPNKVTTGLYFLPGADHVALLFALDRSGSVRDIISQQQEAALALFGRFSQRSSIGVLRFAQKPALVAAFNTETSAAQDAFRFSATTDQRTAIFDAAKAAVDAFETRQRNPAERRIVVLISDGLDTASTVTASSVIQLALAKHVSFYMIHLPLFEPRDGRLEVRTPAKGFRELGDKTGGRYFLVGNGKSALAPANVDLSPVFHAIEEDLKSQYLLGFYIGPHDRPDKRESFSLALVPPGIEYSVNGQRYSRTHKFFVDFRRGAANMQSR